MGKVMRSKATHTNKRVNIFLSLFLVVFSVAICQRTDRTGILCRRRQQGVPRRRDDSIH